MSSISVFNKVFTFPPTSIPQGLSCYYGLGRPSPIPPIPNILYSFQFSTASRTRWVTEYSNSPKNACDFPFLEYCQYPVHSEHTLTVTCTWARKLLTISGFDIRPRALASTKGWGRIGAGSKPILNSASTCQWTRAPLAPRGPPPVDCRRNHTG